MEGTQKQINYATDIINKSISKAEEIIRNFNVRIEGDEALMQEKHPGWKSTYKRTIVSAWESSIEIAKSCFDMPAAQVIEMEETYGFFSSMEWFVLAEVEKKTGQKCSCVCRP